MIADIYKPNTYIAGDQYCAKNLGETLLKLYVILIMYVCTYIVHVYLWNLTALCSNVLYFFTTLARMTDIRYERCMKIFISVQIMLFFYDFLDETCYLGT